MQRASRAINGLDAVYVGRPSKWGNPFRGEPEDACGAYRGWLLGYQPVVLAWYPSVVVAGNISMYRRMVLLTHLEELRGHNLCCWCSLSDECHGDTLLELANKEEPK